VRIQKDIVSKLGNENPLKGGTVDSADKRELDRKRERERDRERGKGRQK